jgi:hypothetical protein
LVEQVRNTMPYLFAEESKGFEAFPYLARMRAACADPDRPLSHEDYFLVCLSAHHATVATYVPTDVDSQIRFKLWHPALPTPVLQQMAEHVRESRNWDWTPVSTRYARSPRSGEKMSGHNGEWFSTAVAAYGAMRKRDAAIAADTAGEILREVQRELTIFSDARAAREGIEMMRAAAVIAHNFGDLQRVLDMWQIEARDPLADSFTKAKDCPAHQAAFELNRRWMAAENHRHFSLRKSRSLRVSPDLLLPLGPFFDDWGTLLSRRLTPEDLAEVIEALIEGWQWLKGTAVGYCRALAGIEESFPGGLNRLGAYLPVRVLREWKAGALRTGCAVPRRRFEEQWKQMALNATR